MYMAAEQNVLNLINIKNGIQYCGFEC